MSKKQRAADEGLSVKQKRQEAQAAEAKAKKTRRTRIICGAAVFVVLAVCALVLTSGWFFRNTTAVKINDTVWTLADYNFEYTYQYTIVKNEFDSMAADYGLDGSLPEFTALKSTPYSGEGYKTWADYMDRMTMDTLKEITVLYEKATAEGHSLTETEMITLYGELSRVDIEAGNNNMDVDTYLGAAYGKGVNKEVFDKNMTRMYLADSYAKAAKESFTYTDAELDAFYNEHADSYDYITYRSFYLSRSNYDDVMATAREFAEAVDSEADFAEMCRRYAPESSAATYENDDASLSSSRGSLMAMPYASWLIDSARKSGDVTVTETENGCYVVMFVNRDSNEYPSANVDYFMVSASLPDASLYESESAYNDATEVLLRSTENTANAIYDEWTGGKSFSAVQSAYSDSVSSSGQLAGVSRYDFDSRVTDWIYDEARQEGDTEIVVTDSHQYFVIRFVGYGDQYSRVVAKDALSIQDYQDWVKAESDNCTVTRGAFKGFTR